MNKKIKVINTITKLPLKYSTDEVPANERPGISAMSSADPTMYSTCQQ
jgi:hypothetical protein